MARRKKTTAVARFKGPSMMEVVPRLDPLNDYERAFIRFYRRSQDPLQASIAAGVPPDIAEEWGERTLQKVNVQAAIAAHQMNAVPESEVSELVRSRNERRRFWGRIALDERMELKDRLKASELLGKSRGDFIHKVEVTHNSLEDLILESMKQDAIDVTATEIEDAELVE